MIVLYLVLLIIISEIYFINNIHFGFSENIINLIIIQSIGADRLYENDSYKSGVR